MVKAISNCIQIAIAAIDGVCAGASAIFAMANRHKYVFYTYAVEYLFRKICVQSNN